MKHSLFCAVAFAASGLLASCDSAPRAPTTDVARVEPTPGASEARSGFANSVHTQRQPTFIQTVGKDPEPPARELFKLASAEMDSAPMLVRRALPDGGEEQMELFSYVQDQARTLAEDAYKPTPAPANFIKKLSYDDYRMIDFLPEAALFKDVQQPYRVMMDTRGSLFHTPIKLNVVGEEGARPVPYDPAQFDFEPLELTGEEKAALGYAGFRLLAPFNKAGKYDEVLSVKGASFFRALGTDNHYGASARGVSIRTASPDGEEFPEFREFWLQQPNMGDESFVFHALLDGPSVTGAYQFRVQPGVQTRMDVKAVLYARKETSQVGLAPLTSMFEFAPHDPDQSATDFRPRVHDSEGLSAVLANGEWIWRPLSNPKTLQISTFATQKPQGFGLVQRTRGFDNYEDLEASYETRPSVWVTPGEGWREGRMVLVEIPTPNEYHDNIISYWQLAEPLKKGESLEFSYQLDWGMETPVRAPLAEVHSTRTGLSEANGKRLFIVDFDIDDVETAENVEAEVTSSSGAVQVRSLKFDLDHGRLRLTFELDQSGVSETELRAVLLRGEQPASETWLYRWSAS